MMRGINRLLLLFLVASICFNVFFIIGYMRSRSILEKLRTNEGRVQLIAKQLKLTKAQEEEIIRLRASQLEEVEKFKKVDADQYGGFLDELLREDPDPEKMRGIVGESSARHNELRMLKTKHLMEVFTLLTPEQRRDFVRMMKEKSFLNGL